MGASVAAGTGSFGLRSGWQAAGSDYDKVVPRIEFVASRAGRGKTLEVPRGGPLVDICDEHLAPVPFSCRSATCGTCHLEVLEGVELLEPPEAEERELLAVLRAPANSRLGCQAVVRPGEGTLRIRPVDS